MPIEPVLFARGSFATSSGTLFTTTTKSVLTDIVISNTSSTQQYVTIAIDSVNIIPTVPVAGNTVIALQPKTVIATAKTITGFSSSADVKYHISGVEIS
jgi:hypothetical protein